VSPSQSHEAFYFALGLFFLALAVFGGHFYSGDGQAYFTVAFKLSLLDAPTISEALHGYGVHGPEGGYYAKFGLGYSLILMPFVLITLIIASLSGTVLQGPVLYSSVMLSGPILGGLGIYLFHRLQCVWGFDKSSRLASSLFFACGGLWLSYTRFLFSELSVAVLLLVAVNGFSMESSYDDWVVGMASGLAVLTRIEVLVLVLPLLYLKWTRGGTLSSLLIPLFGSGCVIGLYNWCRFGNPFFSGMGNSAVETFSTPIVKGFYGQFFAVGNGLFVYAPYLGVAVIVAIMLGVRRELPSVGEMGLVLGGLIYVFIHSAWHSWMGGWSWGPRRMIPLLPFFHLSLSRTWSHASRRLKRLLIFLLMVSVLVNIAGLLGDFNDYYRGTFYRHDVLFSWSTAQIVQQPQLLLTGSARIDNFWLMGFGVKIGSAVVIGLLLAAGWCFVRPFRESGPAVS
jgi:hypothetical protein